jgi:hypothetical protein
MSLFSRSEPVTTLQCVLRLVGVCEIRGISVKIAGPKRDSLAHNTCTLLNTSIKVMPDYESLIRYQRMRVNAHFNNTIVQVSIGVIIQKPLYELY